ncbi:MAG: ABC transporter permease, partial [Oceanibaculum nanhaiense]|nr:ABC transporter permease [Oceanibaculum nanhaiense]
MLIYTAKRLVVALLVALTISLISFGLLFLSGDPATTIAGESADDAAIQAIRMQYGFDKPIHEQYFAWVGRALQGDFGTSFYFKVPVT